MRRAFGCALASTVCAACSTHPGLPLGPSSKGAAGPTAPFGYQVIDLGTLGGTSTVPYAFNDGGQVVGFSELSDGALRALVWADGGMGELREAGPPRRSPPGDGFCSWVTECPAAHAINDVGQVAGVRPDGDDASTTTLYVWESLSPGSPPMGQFQDLDAGGLIWDKARVLSIDDEGDVLAWTRYHHDAHALLWIEGVRYDVGGLAQHVETYPATWNSRHQVVGRSFAYERVAGVRYFHPFLWDNGQIRNLGVLGLHRCEDLEEGPPQCGEGAVTDINNLGVVVGWSLDSSHVTRAFLWENGTMRDLGVFPGQPTMAHAINDRGQVLVSWGSPSSCTTTPHWQCAFRESVVWEDGAWQDLGSLGGGRTRPATLTEDGAVVGSSHTAAGAMHAFVWESGQMTDLGAGTSGRGATAIAINRRGDVLGVSGECRPDFDGSCILERTFRGVLWRKMQPLAEATSGRGR